MKSNFKKNKKGMFFTILAMSLLSLFVLSYSIYYVVEDRESVSKRIKSMNSFIFSLEKDVSRQMYVSGYRGILSLQNYINEDGVFLIDAEESIKEVISNGTIEGVSIGLMEGYRLTDLNFLVSDLGDKMNVIVIYSIINLTISQDDPWNVKVDITLDSFIQDKGNLVSWNRTEIISSKIEIINFEDPLYLINTQGRVANKINKSIYEGFTDGADVSNLSLHVEDSLYIASTSAPSFLDRLEGKTTSNENGIESLVDLSELSEQGVSVKDKSVVDYIYFSNDDPASYGVSGMPSWFKLDNETSHLEIYNVSDLV